MITIEIPGFKTLLLHHLVLDYNGTIATDGKLIKGVTESLAQLAQKLQIHIVTADTFGNVEKETVGIPCTVSILPTHDQDRGKLEYIEKIGTENTVCIGNGRNDHLMLKDAALGIAVIQEEGGAAEAIMAADVVISHILDALNLLTNPRRLVATLRA
jgi:soluble P-type ATPase